MAMRDKGALGGMHHKKGVTQYFRCGDYNYLGRVCPSISAPLWGVYAFVQFKGLNKFSGKVNYAEKDWKSSCFSKPMNIEKC